MPEIGGIMVHTSRSIFREDFSITHGQKTKDWPKFIEMAKDPVPKLVDGLVDELGKLIESKSLRNKIGKENEKRVTKGKFSIEKRNKKLKSAKI